MNNIASLPMYNWPELQQYTNQWWQVLAQNFAAEGVGDVPRELCGHDNPHEDWHHPHLFMSQTCGYPLRFELGDAVQVVAVPRYKTEGCEGTNYSSMVVARKQDSALSLADFGGRCAAFNTENSQSGYSALRAVIAPLAQGAAFFSSTLKTGAHLASMAAVAEKKADICAIDCVVWGLAKHIFPELVAGLCVVGQTPLAPSLPYITAKTRTIKDVQAMGRVLVKSGEDEEHKSLRAHLLVDGFEILPADIYQRIDEIENTAIAANYPILQ